jgi:hypothetical protein
MLGKAAQRLSQAMTMGAIVATLMVLPVGALLALLSFAFLGTSLAEFLSFGRALPVYAGLLAWWALAFLASLVYAVLALPPEPHA